MSGEPMTSDMFTFASGTAPVSIPCFDEFAGYAPVNHRDGSSAAVDERRWRSPPDSNEPNLASEWPINCISTALR